MADDNIGRRQRAAGIILSAGVLDFIKENQGWGRINCKITGGVFLEWNTTIPSGILD